MTPDPRDYLPVGPPDDPPVDAEAIHAAHRHVRKAALILERAGLFDGVLRDRLWDLETVIEEMMG